MRYICSLSRALRKKQKTPSHQPPRNAHMKSLYAPSFPGQCGSARHCATTKTGIIRAKRRRDAEKITALLICTGFIRWRLDRLVLPWNPVAPGDAHCSSIDALLANKDR